MDTHDAPQAQDSDRGLKTTSQVQQVDQVNKQATDRGGLEIGCWTFSGFSGFSGFGDHL
jgi:hypothetical protein